MSAGKIAKEAFELFKRVEGEKFLRDIWNAAKGDRKAAAKALLRLQDQTARIAVSHKHRTLSTTTTRKP